MAGAVSGEKHNTGGGHIKAMHGSLGNIVMKEGGYASGYAVLSLGASSWHGEQSPRFVDYQEIGILMEYAEWPHVPLGGAIGWIPQRRKPRMGPHLSAHAR